MALCANAENTLNDQLSPCLKQASNACTGCFLVQVSLPYEPPARKA